MKLTKREGILLIIVLIAGVLVLFYNFFYMPMQKEIAGLETKYEQIEAEADNTKMYNDLTVQLNDELNTLQSDLEQAYVGFPDQWDQAEMLVYIEDLLEDLCDNQTLKIYDKEENGRISSASIGLEIITDYSRMKKILDKFETGNKFCVVETIEIIPKDENDSEWKPVKLEVKLSIKFYTQNKDKEDSKDYEFMNGKFKQNELFNND